jgi:hypothetical protein
MQVVQVAPEDPLAQIEHKLMLEHYRQLGLMVEQAMQLPVSK